MRLLVIGGTAFLGRAAVEAALARGDSVTTFNRGRSGPDLPGVETLRGDRTVAADLRVLRGREFDAVLDTSGFVPRVVGMSAQLLARATETYAFVSSVSVYAEWPAKPVDEAAAIFDCAPDAGPDDGDYGALKAGSERAVSVAFGERMLLLRPGLILGPHENVGRLPAWLSRIARGGRVLAPGDPGTRMQSRRGLSSP
jgi:2'-hydroxyisoflavone reductase